MTQCLHRASSDELLCPEERLEVLHLPESDEYQQAHLDQAEIEHARVRAFAGVAESSFSVLHGDNGGNNHMG